MHLDKLGICGNISKQRIEIEHVIPEKVVNLFLSETILFNQRSRTSGRRSYQEPLESQGHELEIHVWEKEGGERKGAERVIAGPAVNWSL